MMQENALRVEIEALWEEYLRWWRIEMELGGLDPATRDKVDLLFQRILKLNNQMGLALFQGIARPERFVELLASRSARR